jgi:hypothetical protein
LDSDSISIRTCFLNLLLEFTRTTYPGNLHPIGLPESRPNSLSDLHPSALLDRINAYPALYSHTWLNHLTRFFSRSNFYLHGLTRSYPTGLPYLIFPRSDFFLPDRTWPPYLTSLPGQVTIRCTQLLIRPYPIALPSRVPFNWPHSKTSSSASNLDLCLFWQLMHQDSSGNPKPTRVTLKHPR